MAVALVKQFDETVQPDARWLRLFVEHRDGEAFGRIVQRHGAMVHAVCRRVLHNGADAEDAAQAVFLILAKKASSIRRTHDLAGWLFGVARRVALQALRERTRRQRREKQAASPISTIASDLVEAQEAARLCDAELLRLPVRYRQALVLSCIEGLPKALVAQRLGWPEGTVASCISRGKKLLAERLIRQGIAPALATAVLATPVVQAIPLSLHHASSLALAQASGQSLKHLALPGALELVHKVNTHMMFKRSLLMVACTLGLAATIPGIIWGWHVLAQPAEVVSEVFEPVVQEKPASKVDASPRMMTDKDRLQGRWMLVALVTHDNDAGFDPFAGKIIGSMIAFQGEEMLQYAADGSKAEMPKEVQHLYRLNDKVQPKELDVIMKAPSKEFVIPGLYSLQHDTLIICTSQPINVRPIEISAARNGSSKIAIYRRVVDKGAITEEQKRIAEEFAIAQTGQSLRKCLIAMHNYHNDYNRLPAAAIFDKQTGKPLLSWRVRMLPYLGEDKLYKEFHLDEPWDSEHNRKLIPRMPKMFAHPATKSAAEFKTHYRVFVSPAKLEAGKTDKFAPPFSLSPTFDTTLGRMTVADGTSNTIAIVEATEPVIWTKPEEIVLANDEADIPSLGAMPDSPYFIAVHWDGASHLYRRTGERMSREGYLRLLRQQIGWKDGMNFDVSGILVR